MSREISTTWIKDQSNNDSNREIIDFKGDLNSFGEFTCPNGDYFEGQFFGSISDRSGHLTKPRENGCFTVGLWKNGLLDGIVDMETEGGGWKRVAFKKGLKHGLERSFGGAYPQVNNPKRVACYQEDEIGTKCSTLNHLKNDILYTRLIWRLQLIKTQNRGCVRALELCGESRSLKSACFINSFLIYRRHLTDILGSS